MTMITEFKQKLQALEDLIENDKFTPSDEKTVLMLERDINKELDFNLPNQMELEMLLNRIDQIKMNVDFIEDDNEDYDEDMYREMMQPDRDDDID